MPPKLLSPLVLVTVALLTALSATSSARQSATDRARLTVIVRHLDQPKKLTLTSTGDLLVALSGDGRSSASCTNSAERSCENSSGAVDEVTPTGRVTVLRRGLTSISSAHDDPQATGPVEAILARGRLHVLFQDLDLNASTGVSYFGKGSLLGDLVGYSLRSRSRAHITASFGAYEARHEPDRRVLGSAVKYDYESAINSDPYSFVAYRGGWAVADAGANDVLWISPRGAIRVLAVLPTLREYAKTGTYGSSQRQAITARAQAVPTALALGPDGALYVGELGGVPFAAHTENIYRIVPGHTPTVWARGFTSIGDIGFDRGRLLVLELDKRGLADSGLKDNKPASGELIAVNTTRASDGFRAGARTILLQSGLSMPAGLAVATDGVVYLTNRGTSTGAGEILRYIPSWVTPTARARAATAARARVQDFLVA